MDINIIISTTKHSHKYQNIIQITKIIFYFIRRNLFNEKMRWNKSWWKTSRQSCELYMLQLVQQKANKQHQFCGSRGYYNFLHCTKDPVRIKLWQCNVGGQQIRCQYECNDMLNYHCEGNLNMISILSLLITKL